MKNFKKIIATFLMVLTIGISMSGLALAETTVNAENNVESSGTRYFYKTYRVGAHRSQSGRFYFYAGEQVKVRVVGDGYSDLDVYVYDAHGNLCDSSHGPYDVESLTMNVFRSEYFTIKVV